MHSYTVLHFFLCSGALAFFAIFTMYDLYFLHHNTIDKIEKKQIKEKKEKKPDYISQTRVFNGSGFELTFKLYIIYQ